MVNKNAQRLGRLSYKKNKETWAKRGKKGGKNRWKGTTPEERSEMMKEIRRKGILRKRGYKENKEAKRKEVSDSAKRGIELGGLQ